jgi:hypothetical protein
MKEKNYAIKRNYPLRKSVWINLEEYFSVFGKHSNFLNEYLDWQGRGGVFKITRKLVK